MLSIINYYSDKHVNTYDNITYLGNKYEKIIPHRGEVVVTEPNTCAYCSVNFESRNKLFLHLGYCDVDIRSRNRKKIKYKQLKIKPFLSCSDYDSDIDDDSRIIEMDINSITKMMKGLNSKENKKIMKKIKTKNNINKNIKLDKLFGNLKLNK